MSTRVGSNPGGRTSRCQKAETRGGRSRGQQPQLERWPFGLRSALVSQGCCNKVLQDGSFKQKEFIFSQLWRLEVEINVPAGWGFPDGPVVKNLPYNAGDVGSIPGWGTKIPHAAGQLSPRATTTELVHHNERVRVPRTTEPTCPGAYVPQLERENRHARTREKPTCHSEISHVLQLRPDTAKK